MNKIRLGTLFSGVGAPEQGAKRVYGDDLELVFACEWDKFARESFKANYEIEDEHFHKDIADMDGTQYKGKVDILIGGSPCQDFSIAGLRKGIDGNKGILIYEYIRIVEEVKAPVIVYENVKGMLSDKGGRTVKDFVQALREIGYYCHYEVLNTKDYGVPQNRQRIFLVGFLDHDAYMRFEFAPKIPLKKKLKDVLEEVVDEKYYLSDAFIARMEVHKDRHQERGNGFAFTPKEVDDIESVGCLSCGYGTRATDTYLKVPQEGVIGMLDIKGNDSIRRVYGVDGIAATLTTMQGGNQEPKIMQDGFHYLGYEKYQVERIRKLTPLECFRLQDFPDEALHKAQQAGVSNSQLYKQAGNSMSVNVLEMIFNQIERAKNGEAPDGSLF